MFRQVALSTVAVMLGIVHSVVAEDASALRLVPFPRSVTMRDGVFPLDQKLVLEAPAGSAEFFARQIGDELRRAGLQGPEVRPAPGDSHHLRLSVNPTGPVAAPSPRAEATSQDYVLEVRPEAVVGAATDAAGLNYAVQTLCQLIRANRRGNGLPCLEIADWPSLGWRAFQDDMTRGPSAKLDTLKREVDLGGELKMNLFTYYMEYQFAHKKHPTIGPKDGSFTTEELAALVEHAKPRHVDILGCQQSFAHFDYILSRPEFAVYRETGGVLTPVKEETYQLLDDLYSDVAPVLPFPWFNVCCDESSDLAKSQGPAKELIAQVGEGEVYARHMQRVHDLLRDKYGKRMMMWGDILLLHKDKIDQIPKDTIMLTWGYAPRPNFEDQIIPFAKSGYDFFVCPGVDDWGKVLPNFGDAATNIKNFVRDGLKHGAMGMLNTEWKDDSCNVRSPAWHGYAWGAECAWTGSATSLEDFNRRIGSVLFGEPGDHFGQAIALLIPVCGQNTTGLPDSPTGLSNACFWKNDFVPQADAGPHRDVAQKVLANVRPAIEHLEACKKDAVVNADLLDGFLLGARRIELIAQRMIDGAEACEAYAAALQATEKDERLAKLAIVERLVRKNRDAHGAIAAEFSRIWLTESKPYSLNWSMDRMTALVKWYDELAMKLGNARQLAEAGKPLPTAEEMGLKLPNK